MRADEKIVDEAWRTEAEGIGGMSNEPAESVLMLRAPRDEPRRITREPPLS